MTDFKVEFDERPLDEKTIYYVYGHFYKDHPEIPFLIGKGKGSRLHHNGVHDRNNWWFKIVNKYDYEPRILYEGLDEYDAFALEILLIWSYGRRDQGRGPLVNLTDGGDGISGAIRPEHSKRMSGRGNPMFGKSLPAHSGAWKSGHIPWNLGIVRPKFDKSWRNNMSKSHLGLMWIHDENNTKEAQIKCDDDVPHGWLRGRLLRRRKLYHNVYTKENKMFRLNEVPPDWVLGRYLNFGE